MKTPALLALLLLVTWNTQPVKPASLDSHLSALVVDDDADPGGQDDVPETDPEAPSTETPSTEASSTEASSTEAPETDAPETEAPETDSPETDAPETEAPETDATETDTPETDAPETEAPETDAPETEAPETDAPDTDAPETDAPETDAPETEAPETEAPETEAPETEAPETEAPETEAPETEAPNTDEPETNAPETEAPEIPPEEKQSKLKIKGMNLTVFEEKEDDFKESVADSLNSAQNSSRKRRSDVEYTADDVHITEKKMDDTDTDLLVQYYVKTPDGSPVDQSALDEAVTSNMEAIADSLGKTTDELSVESSKGPEPEPEDDEGGIEPWEISLIVIACALLLTLIVIVGFKVSKKETSTPMHSSGNPTLVYNSTKQYASVHDNPAFEDGHSAKDDSSSKL